MQASAPWTLARIGSEGQVDEIIFLCAESLRICGILLQPYMPAKMKTLLDQLGVAAGDRSYANTLLGSDTNYGVSMVDLGSNLDGVLFPPLTTEF